MPGFVDDICRTCRRDASEHRFCERERALLCEPCGHEGCEAE